MKNGRTLTETVNENCSYSIIVTNLEEKLTEVHRGWLGKCCNHLKLNEKEQNLRAVSVFSDILQRKYVLTLC